MCKECENNPCKGCKNYEECGSYNCYEPRGASVGNMFVFLLVASLLLIGLICFSGM